MRLCIYHNLRSGGAKRAVFETVRRLLERNVVDVYTLRSADHDFCDLRPLVHHHRVFEFQPARLFANPGTRAYLTDAPRQGRGELLQPLPGCVSLFAFYPGVRFAHPRLSSSRPAGAEFGATETVPSHS